VNQLERILATTRAGLAQRRAAVPLEQLQRSAAGRTDPRSFADALARPGLSLIAEHKRRSPSAGSIREGMELDEVVGAYERGGAAALSILTEEANFGGSLDDLRAARAAAALPILRKDFIIDPYQVQESLAAGADAILLIVAALAPGELSALHAHAADLGLSALVEVHDERELEAALSVEPRLIGINNRDLTTLAVDRGRTFELLPRIPAGTLIVAESGFSRREELDELEQAGIDGVLVGEALMRSGDIEGACLALTLHRPTRAL
jgi:indole-3-glycerol phosphate synthase